MTTTYEQLATTTLNTSTASITFNSISASYTDLVLVVNLKLTTSGGEFVAYRVNGDTGTNYSASYFYGNGSSALTGRVTSETFGRFGNGSSTTHEVTIVNFQNYANTNMFKSVISRSNVASTYSLIYSSLWRNTNAINSISIFPSTANFDTGTIASLYGIKAE